MKEKNENNEVMQSKGVRLRDDQWEDCDRLYWKLGLSSRNHFIRDAVDFYIAYLQGKQSARFITRELESVISAKIHDSENRLCRLLFKLAVDQNLLAHLVGYACEYGYDEIEVMRVDSIREVKETNGSIRADDVLKGDR